MQHRFARFAPRNRFSRRLPTLGAGFDWSTVANVFARYDFTDRNTLRSSGASQFDGNTANYLSRPDDPGMNHGGKFSFYAVVKVVSVAAAVRNVICGKWQDTAANREFFFKTDEDDLQAVIYASDGIAFTTASLTAVISAGTWHHVCVTFDSSLGSSQIHLYESTGGTTDSVAATRADHNEGGAFFGIGRVEGGVTAMDGDIGRLIWFDHKITQAEFEWLVNGGASRELSEIIASTDTNNPGTSGMVSFWEMDDRDTRMDTWGDFHATENGTVGRVVGFAEVAADVESRAGDFVAAQGDEMTATISNLNYPISFGCWARRDSGVDLTCISIGDKDVSNHGIRLGSDSSDDTLMRIDTPTGFNTLTGIALDAEWHFYMGVIAADDDYKFYVDDQAAVTNTTSRTKPPFDQVKIGRTVGGGSNGWDGAITQAFLCNAELTSADRDTLYNGGAGLLLENVIEVDAPLAAKLSNGWPISSNEANGLTTDLFGGLTLTNTGVVDRTGIPAGGNQNPSVSRAIDLSGNGRDIVQGTLSFRPVLIKVPSSKFGLIFDGVNNHLLVSISDDAQPKTVIIVYEFTDPTSGVIEFLFDGASTKRHGISKNSSDLNALFAGSTITGSAATSGKHVRIDIVNTTSSSIRVNGGSAQVSGDVGSHVLGALTVGARFDAANPLKGRIYEVIVIDDIPSNNQFDQIGEHLAAKHGFTWSAFA